MPDSPLTQRDVQALRESLAKIDSTMVTLQERMENTYVRKDVLEPALKAVMEDVAEVREWQTWALRIVVGAVLLALVGAVLAQGGAL